MADYGHDLLFGVSVHASTQPDRHVVDLAVLSEEVGLDIFSVPDHPYEPELFDGNALLAYIAARTERIRLMHNLANLPLRPPALLARAAASLDILSGGRFELGLGAGALWDAIAGVGGPRRSPAQAVAALEEAYQVIRALWTPGPPVTFDGEHYRLENAVPGPFPVHGIKIWNGAYQPRMLRLTGRISDGWLPSSPYLPPQALAVGNGIIDEAAAQAGRSPADVRRMYNIAGDFDQVGDGFLRGPAKVWIEQLADLALTEGMSMFFLYLPQTPDQVRWFATEVVPGVREAVAAERAR